MSTSPVTPQRNSRSSFSTPYTPLSLQSFTPNSSTLTTPNSVSQSARAKTKRINFNNSNISIVSEGNSLSSGNKKGHKPSLSDIAESWRSRASEHGIKVSVSQSIVNEDSHYGDDEASDRAFSDANDSFVTTEEALLPPAFLSSRRRPRAQSQALPPTKRTLSSGPLQPTSPNVLRTPARSSRLNNLLPSSASKVAFGTSRPFIQSEMDRSFDIVPTKNTSHTSSRHDIENAIMCTPPPNKARARNLRMKGSFTDPAVLRRRPGIEGTPVRTKHDLSSQSLFNIDENDFEDEDVAFEPSFNQFEYEQSFEFDHDHGDVLAGSDIDDFAAYEANKSVQNDQYMYSPITDRLNDATNYAQMLGLSLPHNYGFNFPTIPSFTQYPSPLPMQNAPLPIHQHPPVPSLSSLHQYPAFGTHFSPPRSMASSHVGVDGGFPPLPLSAAEERFHAQPQHYGALLSSAASVDSAESTSGSSTTNVNEPVGPPTQCSVCHRSARPTLEKDSANSSTTRSSSQASPPLSLAILAPCQHPLCSGCLTSALNIVGEKDMECAVCKKSVSSFKLINVATEASVDAQSNHSSSPTPLRNVDVNRLPVVSTPRKTDKGGNVYSRGNSFLDPFFSSPSSVSSATFSGGFDFGLGINSGFDAFAHGSGMAFDGVRASTPKGDRKHASKDERPSNGRGNPDSVVLRIDNVPWDITPPAICAWLEQPVLRVHVLLDRKGKTLSHAFVEVENEAVARTVLRGEGKAKVDAPRSTKMRSSVLGKGKRARGVTVTRSSQEELMRALFPSWRGTFDGCRPSLAGLDNSHVISTLEGGLLSETEISSLLALVQTPDSHFLKVPSLPFHSLISILSKFPTDVDSRVFWSGNLRDLLYDLTMAALRVLSTRAAGQGEEANDSRGLFEQLFDAAVGCQAFTALQISTIENLGHSEPQTSVAEHASGDVASTERDRVGHIPAALTIDAAPVTRDINSNDEPPSESLGVSSPGTCDDIVAARSPHLDELAKEFGINPQLIEALAQRLSSVQA